MPNYASVELQDVSPAAAAGMRYMYYSVASELEISLGQIKCEYQNRLTWKNALKKTMSIIS
jgi:hypothetical protein